MVVLMPLVRPTIMSLVFNLIHRDRGGGEICHKKMEKNGFDQTVETTVIIIIVHS